MKMFTVHVKNIQGKVILRYATVCKPEINEVLTFGGNSYIVCHVEHEFETITDGFGTNSVFKNLSVEVVKR